MFNFNKKKVFVIGGNGLIGSCIAKSFRKYGAKVFVFDKIKKKSKNQFFFDVGDLSVLQCNLKKIISDVGCPDIFINSSYPKSSDWGLLDKKKNNPEYIESNINFHLSSFIFLTNEIAKEMKKNKIQGSIINISSIYGLIAQNKFIYQNTKINMEEIYSAIKSGINSFSKQIAANYGEYNIRCNTICPGGVINPKKNYDTVFSKNYLQLNPIKRFCTTMDISSLALFLALDTSSYLTGLNIPLDGGRSII